MVLVLLNIHIDLNFDVVLVYELAKGKVQTEAVLKGRGQEAG